MKYIKTYESMSDLASDKTLKRQERLRVLSDMSLELWDSNFNVQVSSEVLRDDKYIVVNIVKRGSYIGKNIELAKINLINRFDYSEIKDVFLSMVSYMESEDYSIKSIEVSENQCYSYSTLTRLQKSSFPFQKVLLMEEELYLRTSTQRPRQMVDYPIGQLIIKFKE